ncbi:MAG: alpha/beta hydrolase [Cyanobacteriota bacterium]|nr:alpha/beta hydrolase [Cyanobacteriota bacterium]
MTQALLLHGALLSRQAMLPLLPHLPGEITWLVPDLAGHGDRRNQCLLPATTMTPAFLAQDLLLRHPELHQHGPWLLLGHSLGALVALELVRQGVTSQSLILGDPPLWPCGDTGSQCEAQVALGQTPLGIRLLEGCFAAFNGTINYANLLEEISAIASIKVLVGLRGRHQLDSGGWDCGTFISETNRHWLHQWAMNARMASIQQLSGAGHFVFHNQEGLNLLRQQLQPC